MKSVLVLSAATVMAVFCWSSATTAQTPRCECTVENWRGDCTAAVTIQDKWAKVTSSHQQCSRVDWYLNAEPKVTIVTDGVETTEILLVSPEVKAVVQSCKICKDHMLGDALIPRSEPVEPVKAKGIPTSPFEGTWKEAGTSGMVGQSADGRMILRVDGTQIVGRYGPKKLTEGWILNDEEAHIDFPGAKPFGYKLKLRPDGTIKFSVFPFGNVVLEKMTSDTSALDADPRVPDTRAEDTSEFDASDSAGAGSCEDPQIQQLHTECASIQPAGALCPYYREMVACYSRLEDQSAACPEYAATVREGRQKAEQAARQVCVN